ncbi:MAG: hypothetical protein ACI304_08035 [Lepagella sp.]
MKKTNIETLLLQEMEDIKGGAGEIGVCECTTMAGQSTGTGICHCTLSGAGQKAIPDPEMPVCKCNLSGALQKIG